MKENTYKYDRTQAFRYTFISTGKRRIQKEVVFTPTIIQNVFNMGFGDVLPDGSIDDKANSNNGDIRRILATLVQILIDFTSGFPEVKSSNYYAVFSKEFVINALIQHGSKYVERPFAPTSTQPIIGFFIRKKY
jgi:hypothetical protein